MVPEPDFQLFTSLRYDPLLLTIPSNTTHWPTTNPPPSPFYMLPHHRDRLVQAAEHFSWSVAASAISGTSGFLHLLHKLEEAIDITTTTPLRVKTLLFQDGKISVEISPAVPVSQFDLFPHRLPPPKSSKKKSQISPLTGGALTVGEGDAVHGDPITNDPWDVVPDTVQTTPSPYTRYKTTSRGMYSNARERVWIEDMAAKKEVLILSVKDGEVMEGSLTSVYFWRDGLWITPSVESGGQEGTTRRWALEKAFCAEGIVREDELVDGEECWISNGVRGFTLGKVKLS